MIGESAKELQTKNYKLEIGQLYGAQEYPPDPLLCY